MYGPIYASLISYFDVTKHSPENPGEPSLCTRDICLIFSVQGLSFPERTYEG